jgi:arsenate reductase (thioredoxin)
MAEALLRRWGGPHFHAFSAGIAPRAEIDSFACELLRTYNVGREGLHPKSYDEFIAPNAPAMDFIISVGSAAPAGMPIGWPGHPQMIHWRITDPVVEGRPVARTRSFQAAFHELETRIKLFVLVHQRETTRKIASTGLIGGLRGVPQDRAGIAS